MVNIKHAFSGRWLYTYTFTCLQTSKNFLVTLSRQTFPICASRFKPGRRRFFFLKGFFFITKSLGVYIYLNFFFPITLLSVVSVYRFCVLRYSASPTWPTASRRRSWPARSRAGRHGTTSISWGRTEGWTTGWSRTWCVMDWNRVVLCLARCLPQSFIGER